MCFVCGGVVCAVYWQVQVLMDSPCPSVNVHSPWAIALLGLRAHRSKNNRARERRARGRAEPRRAARARRKSPPVHAKIKMSRSLQPRELTLHRDATKHTWERARQRRLRVRCALRCKPAAFRSATSLIPSSCPDCPRSSWLINSACVRKSETTWEIWPTLSSSAAAAC